MNIPIICRTLAALLIPLVLFSSVRAADENEMTPEVAARYEQMLVRSPQPGAAFDRVVDFYSTRGGGLEALQKRWETASQGDDPSYRILQGLLAERLRRPDDARQRYQEAMSGEGASEGQRLAAARLLATLETTEGNFPAAVKAWEAALATGNLPPMDRLDLMRSLALLHQRAFNDDLAVAIWKQALEAFPEDANVLDEAGEAFLTAGNYALARSAFEQLRKTTAGDPYRRIAASLRLARTAEMEGKPDEASTIYLQLLEETSDGSWNQREVRSRIEELFRRSDDLPGLLACYAKRTATAPKDFLTLAAQSRVLDELGRIAEATDLLRQATKLAPDEVSLRLQLVRLLAKQGLRDDAIAEAESLARPEGITPDVLVVLGDLHWERWEAAQDVTAKEAALRVWGRIAPESSRDSGRIVQLAELLFGRGEVAAAEAQWQRLLDISPASSDARLRLAGIFKQEGRDADARAVIAGMVAEGRDAPENYLSRSRAEESFEWADDARATVSAGLRKYPDNFEILGVATRQAMDLNDAKAVADLLPRLWRNAPNPFFADDVIRRHVSFLALSKQDGDSLIALNDKLQSQSADPLDVLILLRLAIAGGDETVARRALAAVTNQNDAGQSAKAAADVASAFGDVDEQIATRLAVASADPRMAVTSLQEVARLQAEQGKIDDSLSTLSQAISKSPADANLYRSYAGVAMRSGRLDDAAARLREGIRYAEEATSLQLELAQLLGARGDYTGAAKALQEAMEAMEAESAEGRRMEIFRRQIEVAMSSGRIDDLITSLKDKQGKERDGARYGTYLAEIYLLQNDFLSAREELSRSLGRNPENPQAVTRLLELSERAGDQKEAIRLSARLVELQPSRENLASHLIRVLQSGELDQARDLLQQSRADILREPAEWSGAIEAIQNAGLIDEANAVIDEIGASNAGDPQTVYEIARLRLSRQEADAAKNLLWPLVENPAFAPALTAVLEAQSSRPTPPGAPELWMRMQSLQQIQSSVTQALQQSFQGQAGGRSWRRSMRGFPGMGAPVSGGANAPTADEETHVRALFLLAAMARADQRLPEFYERIRKLLEKTDFTLEQKYLVFLALNDSQAIQDLIRKQAVAASPDPGADRWIASVWQGEDPELEKDLETIRQRAAVSDPSLAFMRELNELQKRLIQSRTAPNQLLPEEKKAKLREEISKLMNHPARKDEPPVLFQLAMLASMAGDFKTANGILDEQDAKSAGAGAPASPWGMNLLQIRLQTVGSAIALKSPEAPAMLETLIEKVKAAGAPSNLSASRMMIRTSIGFMNSPMTGEVSEITIGDEAFPFQVYQAIAQMVNATGGKESEPLGLWFEKQSGTASDALNLWTLGVIYSEWTAGKRSEAIARVEKIHSLAPTPRTAALLLELYSANKQADDALEMIDAAVLQSGETPDARALRRLRLLQAANRTDEAGELAKRMIGMRLSQPVRAVLPAELNKLGIATQNLPQFSQSSGRSRSSSDPATTLRTQIEKLLEAKRADEAEQILLAQLRRPFPRQNDYQSINIRQAAIQLLRNMERSESWKSDLRKRMKSDPKDVTAAILLLEAAEDDELDDASRDLLTTVRSSPSRVVNLSYAFSLLQRRSQAENQLVELQCSLIKQDAGRALEFGIDLQQLVNSGRSPESRLAVATTLAGLSEDEWSRLVYPMRLSGNSMEEGLLNQLAESSIAAGKLEPAVVLLKRAGNVPNPNYDPSNRLTSKVRLAEIQRLAGQSDDAANTMKSLIESVGSPGSSGTSRPISSMGSRETLNMVLMRLLTNGMNGDGGGMEQIARLAKIADQTGTLDELTSELEEQNQKTPMPISMSLLLRTTLDRPEIGAEWKQYVLSESPPEQFFTLALSSTVIEALTSQKDGLKLVVEFLKKLPVSFYNTAPPDQALSLLADTLPTLAPMRGNPAVQKHVERLVNRALSDPNGPQNLLYSSNYQRALQGLVQTGMLEEARKLLDFTESIRSQANQGRDQNIQAIERRLLVLEGQIESIQIVLAAGLASLSGEIPVNWQMAASTHMKDEPDDSSDEQTLASWDPEQFPMPARLKPRTLDIFAGTNAMNLKKVATVKDPAQSGQTTIKVLSPVGLLQARWSSPKSEDSQWGPLTAYVTGDNLLAATSPEPEGTPPSGVRIGSPGPLGAKSASSLTQSLAVSELQFPLGDVDVSGFKGMLIFTGWVSGGETGDYPPRPGLVAHTVKGETRADSIYLPRIDPGQWRQFVQISGIGEGTNSRWGNSWTDVASIRFFLEIQARQRFNNMGRFSATWAGVQVVKDTALNLDPEVSELLGTANTAAAKGENERALSAWWSALELNPQQTLRNGGVRLLDLSRKTQTLDRFFDAMSTSALYLADPLRGGRRAVQDDGWIAALASEAASPNSSPNAKRWLKRMATVPLSDLQRLAIDAAVWRSEVTQASGNPAIAAKQVRRALEILGFAENNEGRLRRIWASAGENSPITGIVNALRGQKLQSLVLEQLKESKLTGEMVPSRQMLEAWMIMDSDPAASLELWKRTLGVRKTGTPVSFGNDGDRRFLLELAEIFPEPDQLLAGAKMHLDLQSSDPASQRRALVEVLFQITQQREQMDGSDADVAELSAKYRQLWMDAELNALTVPGYAPVREQIRKVTSLLVEAEDWQRVEALLDVAKNHKSLQSSEFRNEFDQLRKLLALARGNYDAAWPVAWIKQSENPGKSVVHWQWNIRDTSPDEGFFDSAIAVADKPVMAKFPGQIRMEVLFGVMPSELRVIGSKDGTDAEGEMEVALPSPVGFLRTVAVFEGKRLQGPMVPVVSGKRVFPSGDSSLTALLTGGRNPLSIASVKADGMAPDGSPAVMILTPEPGQRLSFEGTPVPLEPGKFYVQRAWQRRAGTGGGALSVDFVPEPGADFNVLGMILTQNSGSTGQWVLFTRAVPTYPDHTFWIPFQKVSSGVPRFYDIPNQTRVAGWELIEVSSWAYGKWIEDLAMLRDGQRLTSASPMESADLDKALALAAIEPLTALDYHATWLVEQMVPAGRVAPLLELFQAALTAEANPLFSRPKLNRIFGPLQALADREDAPMEVRRAAVQLGLDHRLQAGFAGTLEFQQRWLDLSKDTPESAPVRRAILDDLKARLMAAGDETSRESEFLSSVLSQRTWKDDRQANTFFQLMVALEDQVLIDQALELFQNKRTGLYSKFIRSWIALQIAACGPDWKPNEEWNQALAEAIEQASGSSNSDELIRWMHLLGNRISTIDPESDAAFTIRKAIFDLASAKDDEKRSNRTREYLRAVWLLVETAVARGDDALVAAVAGGFEAQVASRTDGVKKLSEDTLRVATRAIRILLDQGHSVAAEPVIARLRPYAESFPKVKAEFDQFSARESGMGPPVSGN